MPIFAFILLGILLCAFAGLAFFFFLYDHRDKYYRFEDDAVMTGKDFYKTGITLEDLGIGHLDKEALLEYLNNGNYKE